jgi:hypothetical protein
MSDPIRLRDPRSGASPELRDLLAAGRSELPDAKRLSVIAGRFALASPVPGRIDALAHGAGKWLGTGAGKVGLAALLVGVGTTVAAVRSHTPPTSAQAPEVGVASALAMVAPPTSIDAPVASRAPPDPPPTTSAVHPTRVGRAQVPATTGPAATTSSAAVPEVHTSHPPGWAPSTWGSSMAPSPVTPDDTLLTLDRALRDERSSDRADEQRDVRIIEALVRLGRMSEARERAARFMRVFPGSSHRREVADLVGFDPGSQNR